jgi:prepilin-type N-terminal cleavage/methylation domain-containing protein
MDQKMKRGVQRGFTLIEVMLVVVIIGIMSSIAIPLYSRASAKAYRSEMLIMFSKMELYFKNLYESQGNYLGPNVVPSGSSPDVMPDPGNTVSVGQGAEWKPTQTGGWNDLPFPPSGDIRMRYWYQLGGTNAAPTVMLMACGSFPGFGTPSITFGTAGAKCNYMYTETMRGANIDNVVKADGTGGTDFTETPANSFQ